MNKTIRAFGIFSGGLDSLLSARILMDQGIEPTLVAFTSPFFPPDQARAGAAQLGLPLTEVDMYPELLALIKNPPHGLGRNLNPCIDCHALMFQKAGQLLDESGQPGFLFSGEVQGQRPMSQNPNALKTVAKQSGRRELILRPLSAKIMSLTEAEEKGWVDREKLLNLSGRGRRPQMDLAAHYGLKVPPPAGGCLLTDVGYAKRFKWLLRQAPAGSPSGWPPARLAEMLKRGRLFTPNAPAATPQPQGQASPEPVQWLIVGRNQADNQALTALLRDGDTIFHLEGAPGPTVVAPNLGSPIETATLNLGRDLAVAYGDHASAPEARVRIDAIGGPSTEHKTTASKPADWEKFMVKFD
ncbi:MAG: tRNA 4-thiouridine(8) synthase ThiI [Candidatus Adiutrix sp.]|jgi:hypothetical protein|nr:tRNA 4-thiouridine(8) synthase ThiI [Candidatus Adiutrix sp.]